MSSRFIFILVMWISTVFTTFSQQDFKAFKNLSIGLKASPFLGYGFEAATGLNNHFILRLGVNMTKGINFNENNFELPNIDNYLTDRFGYTPEFRAKPELNLMHGNLLLDIHPYGIFHFTVGAFAGSSKFGINGYLVDGNNRKAELLPGKDWPSYEIDNQILALTDGRANVNLQLGNTFKPYFGLGLGHAVAKNKRIAFKFELGLLYQGSSYLVTQNGKTFHFAKAKEEEFRDIDNLLHEWYFKYWPQINFQLSYRFF